MNKEEQYNKSILHLISALVVSCKYNLQNDRYLEAIYGQKRFEAYDHAIKKVDDILDRGVENITEDEVYWALSNIHGGVRYNGQYVDRYLFAKRLYYKLQKLHHDSLNNNRLVRMLKGSKFLWMYVTK